MSRVSIRFAIALLALLAVVAQACGRDGDPVPAAPSRNLVDARAVPIAAVTATGAQTLEVSVWGGIAPCFLIDRVDVQEDVDHVELTVYAGTDPADPDAVCIEIAELTTIVVEFEADLGNRAVFDGATGELIAVETSDPLHGSTTSEPRPFPSTSPRRTSTDTGAGQLGSSSGLVDIRAVDIDSVSALDHNTLEVSVWGGIAPCFLIDRVDVQEDVDQVELTVYAGTDPAHPDAVCIEIAELTTIVVELEADLGNRTVFDGATGEPVKVG